MEIYHGSNGLAPRPLSERVARLMEGNRVEGAGFSYTRPARRTYPHQWLWDSCFHAIIHQALGRPDRARDELRALFRAQVTEGPDHGRLPHMTFIGDEAAAGQDEAGAAAQARDVALWGNPRASTITQPPIIAEVLHRLADRNLWRELWSPLCAYYDWWLRRRDPDADHLYAIWHPWECGADATPRADAACARVLAGGRVPRHLDKGTINPTARKREDLLRARFLLLEDLQAIDAAEHAGALPESEAQDRRQDLLGLEGVDIQAYLVRNLLDLAAIGEALGEVAAGQRYRAAAAAIITAVNDKLWDEERGLYLDRWGRSEQPVPVATPTSFIALYAGELVPADRAARLLDQLLDPQRFWTRWPIPSVSRLEATFSSDEYWRGSTWVNVNWFVVRGLIATAERLDDARFLIPAREIARRTLDLVAAVGFREYYRSGAGNAADEVQITPAGFGPEAFSWSGLVLDLASLLETHLGHLPEPRS